MNTPAEPYHNQLHRRMLTEHVQRAAVDYAVGALLDVGCGTKPYASFFLPKVSSYTGIDVEDRGGADVIGSAISLPFEDGAFDTVVSFQVLEHVPEPDRMLCECARVLKAGGHLILTAPFAWPIHEEPNDYFRFSEYGLRFLAEGAGLDVRELWPMGGLWAYLATRVSYFLYGRSRKKGTLNRLACRCVQSVGGCLDRRYPSPEETHNYTMVARKV